MEVHVRPGLAPLSELVGCVLELDCGGCGVSVFRGFKGLGA